MADKDKSLTEKKTSRRTFIKNSGFTVGGLVLGGALGTLLPRKEDTNEVATETVHSGDTDYTQALQFFRRQTDFDAISAAMEVIYPEDSNGPGALALGANYFLDKQLAGTWGSNSDDYRKAPFQAGETPLDNGQIFIEGARKLNEVAVDNYKGDSFSSLDEDKKIEILQKFEAGEIEMNLVPSAQFFTLLRSATLQGCFCDPLYGGNKNMAGWKMKEFPGAQMSYYQYAESEEFLKIDPVALGGKSHE